MIQFFGILVLFLLLTKISHRNSCSCSLKYKDFPEKESVLLWNPSSLVNPENDGINLKENDEIFLACPGFRNFLDQTGTEVTRATCVSGQTLKIGTKKHLFSNLNCAYPVTGECQETTTVCGGASRGVIINIGHKVNGRFLKLFEVCYSYGNGETIYAVHVIFGSAIDFAKPGSIRPCFKEGCLTPRLKAGNSYTTASQLKTLTNILLSENLAKKYINFNINSYMAKGHLAPYADQVFVTSKSSTNFYINTVPQWQQINNGNWKSVEFSIRKLASKTKENIQVITGGWKVLQLEDVYGTLVDIYLSGELLPVPKFVWKIAYNSKTKKGIAFISLNNPFISQITKDAYICSPITCKSYGWGTMSWTTIFKGFVYCCGIDDLRRVVNTIPDLQVSGILNGPMA